MPKVLIVQPIAQEGIDLLLNQGYEVKRLYEHSQALLVKEVVDADAILVRDGMIPRAVIERGKRLQVISRHGAGLERIDVDAATEHGVYVTRTPIANSLSVAEHVIGLMLALAKNLVTVDRELRRGNFEIRHQRYGIELEGRTLGILGLGNIGSRLGKKAANGLGMRVIGYDPYVDRDGLDPLIQIKEDWHSVFQEADFVSLHVPLTHRTRGLVGLDQFRIMKKSAFFINCSRGPIVKEADLIVALKEGLIAGAGIDVYDPDPPAKNHPLFAMDNVIVTPHSAAHTREAMINMATQAAQGIIEVLSNRKPTWPANQIEPS